METISFAVPLPPTALRRNSQTANHHYRAKLVREYQEEVWCRFWAHGDGAVLDGFPEHYLVRTMVAGVVIPGAPWERVKVTLVWKHHRAGPDQDNALASCKALIDVLHTRGQRPLGIFRDDSADCMTVEMRTEKVRSKADEGVIVEVERIA